MLRDLEYVKETIDLRKDDIQNNEFETNDLLMEDILQALGYNKKRDPGVKAVYSGEVNWQVGINGENRFVVYVHGYMCNESLDSIPVSVTTYAKDNGYPIILSTDGLRLSINTTDKQLCYIPDIFTDEAEELLTYLSKQDWDIYKLIEVGNKISITQDTLINTLKSDDILSKVASLTNIAYNESTKTQLEDLVDSVISGNNTSKTIDNAQIELKEAEISSRESKLTEKEEALSLRETQLTERAQSLDAREAELTSRETALTEREEALSIKENNESSSQEQLEEVTELSEKVEKLRTEAGELEGKKDSISKVIEGLTEQEGELNQRSNAINTEIAGLKTKKDSLSYEVDQLITKKSSLEGEIADLENLSRDSSISSDESAKEISELKSVIEDQAKQVESLSQQLSEANKSSSDTGNTQINQLQSLIDSLREENEQLKSAPKQEIYKDLKFETEGAYREKIASMSGEIQKITAELQEYKDKMDEIERIKAGAEDERIVLGRTLLEAVEDNKDLPRTYVGVVDSKLFQLQDATKFVGTCLQELYNVVQFDLMQILFDGDVFKIIQPAVRGDLMINTKKYDIDLAGFNEGDIINRLKAVFNKFPNVIFMCKAIGTLDEEVFKAQINSTAANMDNLMEEDQLAIDFDDTIGGENLNWDLVSDGLQSNPDSVDSQYQSLDELETINTPNILYLGSSFNDAVTVVSDPESPVYNISAIGDNTRLFKIRNETFYDIINDGVSALISILQSSKNGVLNLQNTDLSLLDERIVAYDNTTPDSIAIPFSLNYFVNVNSIYDCVMVILAIARMLGISEQQAFFYFEANYTDNPSYGNMFIQGDQINLNRPINYDELTPVKQVVNCMVRGDDIRSICMLHESRSLLERLVKGTMAFRRQGDRGISFKDLQSIANFVSAKLSEMQGNNNYIEIVDAINQNLTRKLVYLSDEDISGNRAEAELHDGSKIYLEDLNGYECMLLMMAINVLQFNDDQIEMRLDLNSSIYFLYKENIDTSNVVDYLTGKLFMEYIEGKIKIIG